MHILKNISSKDAKTNPDKDFTILQRLWKGIPSDLISEYNENNRFSLKDGTLNPFYVLKDEEKQFLIDNKLMTADGNRKTVSSYTRVGILLKR